MQFPIGSVDEERMKYESERCLTVVAFSHSSCVYRTLLPAHSHRAAFLAFLMLARWLCAEQATTLWQAWTVLFPSPAPSQPVLASPPSSMHSFALAESRLFDTSSERTRRLCWVFSRHVRVSGLLLHLAASFIAWC